MNLELTLSIVWALASLVVGAIVRAAAALAISFRTGFVTVRIFAENLSFDRTISFLVFDKFWIHFKDIETLFDVELIVQTDTMGDLVVLFD